MEVFIHQSKEELGKAAAAKGADLIRKSLEKKGHASIIVATGTSQFEMLNALIREDVDWSGVSAFHLDEYIGIPPDHPASFRLYLKDRFVDQVALKAFRYIDGEVDPATEIRNLNSLIAGHRIDVAFIGIGENGHLAFNDPPADFETRDPYIEVVLDKDCRQQQFNEGWFPTVEDVPERAISMSVHHILQSDAIICSVPGARKAMAVKRTMETEVTPDVPATALKKHSSVYLYLDGESSDLLKEK
jgi:glucosamine-6-phosphate deaminase